VVRTKYSVFIQPGIYLDFDVIPAPEPENTSLKLKAKSWKLIQIH